ncbi:putative bifunctional diguanylate cyclase/phosphodiesterase [Paraglaciecola arctica]|uniref:Signaling protein ykoW n=1 Tax=Paraglaciecola arctica BSs20135 TaxID=493475 RepID=K6ZES7_9ALTE|nr:bifunctional diguanylate cyclase/phosphodiesterase [Paraglaciecola arctica]GAC21915.1 signaling protein ykoW [Paraglaciecola arctica BSs20135]
MRKFVSLSTKIMSLLMAFLLVASGSLTYLWVNKNNQDYYVQQQTLRAQDQKQFELIRDLLRTRVESWFESFVHFQANYSDNIEATAFFFKHEFDYLQLNWQINNLWLFDKDNNLRFGTTSSTPNYVFEDVSEVINTQSSISHIRCAEKCQQQISMPILSNSGEMVILSISSSLLEALAALNRSTFAKLAILGSDEANSKTIKLQNLVVKPPISFANKQFMEGILSALPKNLLLSQMLDSGHRLASGDNIYLLNLLPIDPHLDGSTYLMFLHDISEASLAHKEYQAQVLMISIVVVVLCVLALFLMTWQFRRRLLLVAEQLPLLAQKKYQEFRAHKFAKNRFFVDEIELLQDSASLLGEELESLDQKIEQNTRELENIAMYDRLTGLPNRNMLNHQLKKLLATMKREANKLTVMFVDFDKFRKVNDTHGHDIGDAFLINAAQRIRGCLRDSDMLFRFGADEFVVVFLEKRIGKGATILATKLIESFREPIAVNELLFYTSSSIGIASTEDSSVLMDDLVRQSDMAMYVSKDSGGNKYSTFSHVMQKAVLRKVELENEVRDALERDEFSFALQPQVEIASGELFGFEALIRWCHPDRGFIPPDEFIPLIENTKTMLEIGYWGLKKAFEILQKLDELGFTGLKIAVNLSASQFLDPDLLPFLSEQIKVFKRDPSQIELELTERTVVADIDQTLDTMQQLKAMGFIFSIDDFGTGYSSLAYLKQMPVDIIKIDRSFVSGMSDNNADMQIVSSTIAMVQKLGMQVVAEGVETAAQMKLLQGLHCEIGQGYFISRPIPENDLYALLPEKLQFGVWDQLDKLGANPNLPSY